MKLTGKGLAAFAKSKEGTPYVYGMKGERMTLEKFRSLQNMYNKNLVWDSDINKVGKICVDCSGLISWYTGNKYMYGSSGLREHAIKEGDISTLDQAPVGAILWQSGHVGIYVGKENDIDYCYEARGSKYGVVKSRVKGRGFKKWLLMGYIDYTEAANEMFETTAVIINKEIKHVNAVKIAGNNYIKLQDLNNTVVDVTYTNMPILSLNTHTIKIKIGQTVKQVNAINVRGANYVRLKDLNSECLHISYEEMPVIEGSNPGRQKLKNTNLEELMSFVPQDMSFKQPETSSLLILKAEIADSALLEDNR